ncbi:MAG: hypothetical protein P8182_15285, partial [Deltaproteobacteria bacterium]
MARVDSLPDAAKGLLQTGSVIEREFSYELIKTTSGLSEQELLSHLSVLKDAELLYERGIYPECTYVFKHALTREVVYDSLLSAKRQKLHGQIARAIEGLHREDLREHFGVLAEHYVASEDYDKGAYYSEMASEQAEKTASINDSIAYCRKRVSCLEKLPKTEEIMTRLIDARTALGFYLIQMRHFPEAKEAVEPILDSLILSQDKKRSA